MKIRIFSMDYQKLFIDKYFANYTEQNVRDFCELLS